MTNEPSDDTNETPMVPGERMLRVSFQAPPDSDPHAVSEAIANWIKAISAYDIALGNDGFTLDNIELVDESKR